MLASGDILLSSNPRGDPMNNLTRQRIASALKKLTETKHVDQITGDMLSDLAGQYSDTRGFETRENLRDMITSAQIIGLRIHEGTARCCPTVLTELRALVYCLKQIDTAALELREAA